MGAVVTLDEAKAWLGEATAYADPQISAIVEGAVAAVERAIGSSIAATEVADEYHDGDGRLVLYLGRMPAISVSTVTIDGTQVNDCVLEESFRLYRAACFPYGRRNVVVTYMAGYNPVPDDLKLAVLMLVKFYAGSQLTARSMWFEGGGGVGQEHEWPNQVKMIVGTYRMPSVV